MTSHHHRLALGLIATGLGLSSLAHGQTAPSSGTVAPVNTVNSETITLPDFTVTTDRDRGYYSSNSAAGSVLSDKPIKELPIAISVINRDLLDDLQTNNIGEALQFSAAFSPESGMIRGQGALDPSGQFSNRVGYATNGVPESGNVERIELIKGPPSLLMSSSSAGGSINIIPKRPTWRNGAEAEYQFGNFQRRYRIDVNRALTPKLATRLNVQYTDGDTNGDQASNQSVIGEFDHDKRLLVASSTIWKPFPKTTLGLDIEQVHDRANRGNKTSTRFATVTQNGVAVRMPWYLAYGMPQDWSITGPDILTGKDHRYITGQWAQDWTNHIKTELNIYNQWYNEKTFAGNQNIEESTTVAGFNGKRAVRVSSYDRTQTAQRTTQISFRTLMDYKYRNTKHILVLRYNYYSFYTDANSFRAYTTGTNSLTGLVSANETKGPWFLIEGATADQMRAYDRSYPTNLDYLWRYTQDTHDNPQRHQGNIIYTGEFPTRFGKFYTIGGISYHSQIETYQTKFALVGGQLTNPRSLSRPHRFGSAPSAGFVWQVNDAVGFYTSYLESFQVPAVFNSFNELMPNREGVSYESGVKVDFLDRKVTGTLSYFSTVDKNRTTNDPGAYNINTKDVNGNGPRDPGFDPTNLAPNTSRGDTVAVGEYSSKGVDFEMTFAPGHGLQATLSATVTSAEVSDDPNPSVRGSKLAGYSDRNYGGVMSYRFPEGRFKGLSLGGGYRHSSDRYLGRVRQNNNVLGSPFVDYWQPSFNTLMFFGKYTFKVGRHDAWVQFNVDNILKSKKYINEQSYTNLTIYGLSTPVIWRVTSGMKF